MATFNNLGQVKSIVIMRLSAIGDCVITVPMVQTIHKYYPEIQIDWIIDPIAYQLLKGLPGVNFIVVQKPKKLKDYRQFYKDFKGKQWDVLIASQYSLRANLLYPAISAKLKLGYGGWRAKDLHSWFINAKVDDKPSHLLDGTFEFLQFFGETRREMIWPLELPDLDQIESTAEFRDEDYVVINPAASDPERSWSSTKYAEITDYITTEYRLPVVLTGGPTDVERQLASSIEQKSAHPVVNLVGKTSLKELASILKHAKVVIAPDTGPAHIASALGAPTIGLYAVITAKATGPYTSLEHTVDVYYQAAEKYLKKTPQQLKWGERVHHHDVMNLITVDMVQEKLDKLL
jgi:heptosyltransferase I